MRIISGKFRGRKISPPPNLPVRPTTDFAKEGLFNYLSNRIEIEDLKVLDLFSGTGGISLEFVSRGAAEVISVDENFKCINFLKKISSELKINSIRVLHQDVFRFVGFTKEKFDLIFADPPYELNNAELLPKIVFERELLNKEGLFIIEHPGERKFKDFTYFEDQRNYGKVNFSFFRNSDELKLKI